MNPIAKKLMATANKAASGLYRKTNGKVGSKAKGGLPVLILTVAGRKSGLPRSVPVAYFRDGGTYIVVGSAGGMKEEPDWIKNLAATDKATIQVGETVSPVAVHIADTTERERLWRDVVMTEGAFFADYEKKSGRTLRLGVLTPR